MRMMSAIQLSPHSLATASPSGMNNGTPAQIGTFEHKRPTSQYRTWIPVEAVCHLVVARQNMKIAGAEARAGYIVPLVLPVLESELC